MPRWKIGIVARAQVEVDIEVEAETREEAEKAALAEAISDPDCACWEISEGFITDQEVCDVEQLQEEEEEA